MPRAIVLALVLGIVVGQHAAAQPARHSAVLGVSRLGDRILDPAARGNVTFENTANVASYQQDGILTYRGWQYTGWYRGNRRAVIARRELPDGRWQSTELDYDLFSDDSHNTIALTVTPSDGRIHVAFPTHANAIRYTRSLPGVADRPDEVEWSSQLFERTRNSLPGAPDAPATYTYPQFELVHGRMLLTYRDGGSDNGRQVLLRYDDSPDGTWTFLGRFTSSEGTWSSPYGTSTSRYGYLHGFSVNPVNGNIEIGFTWRERTSAWCAPAGVGNHEKGYAFSPDGGMTWQNNGGEVIGRTGSPDLISIDDEHMVEEIPINRGLMNQEAQAFDSQGRLHVMTSRVPERDLAQLGGCVTDFYPDRARLARPYHSWRGPDGTWHTMELPTLQGSSGRTKLVFDRHDSAYVILPDARIIAARAKGGWRDWRIVWRAEDVENVSELIVDRSRIRHDGVLTVAYQEPSSDNAPSAYRIADFRLSTRRGDQPKATVPEAPPAPFEGTANDAGNLALNRSGEGFPSAFADDFQPAFPPRLANDGNLGTFWVSAGTLSGEGPSADHPIHVGVDLGEPKQVAAVTMIPRPSFGPTAYSVEVSEDGEAWTQAAAEPAVPNAFDWVISRFPPVTARYVRLRITGSWDRVQPPRNVQVAELEVVGSTSAETANQSRQAAMRTATPTTSRVAARERPRGLVEHCSPSIGGGSLAFTSRWNLVVGPLALKGAGVMLGYAEQVGGNKLFVYVKGGHRVTLELSRQTRRGAGLAFGRFPSADVRLRHTRRIVTFIACRRGELSGPHDGWPVTGWVGFLLASSPRCVPLNVWVDDEPSPRRAVIRFGVRTC